MAANVVANARGNKAARGSLLHALWENIKSLAGAVLIYLVINTFLIAAYRIPSGSMIPTLLIGDWLFVNKAVYGPHIPFTNAHLPSFSEPKRGEVIVFVSPYQADQLANHDDPTPTLVKRMVGMPGDTLHMRRFTVRERRGATTGFRDREHAIGAWRAADRWFAALRMATSDRAPEVALRRRTCSTTAGQLGSAPRSGRHLLHDGRQPIRIEGQPVLGHCAA